MLTVVSSVIAVVGLLLIVAGWLTRTGRFSRNPLVSLGTPKAARSAQARAAVRKITASTLSWAGIGGLGIGAVLLMLAPSDPDVAAMAILAALWMTGLVVAGIFRARDIALRIERQLSAQ